MKAVIRFELENDMNKPNIIIIMTDQQRAGMCGREGFALDVTPFADQWAKEGKWFDKAYTPCPLCAPARVSMLTGRWPTSTRVITNPALNQRYVPYTKDLFDVVKSEGYKTALVGKNHSHVTEDRVDYNVPFGHSGGSSDDKTPEEIEFDKWMIHLNHGTSAVATPFPVKLQAPCRLVNKAIDWIDEMQDDPFFMWLSFAEPHNPFQAPEPYFSMFPTEELPPVGADRTDLKSKGFKWEWCHQIANEVYADYDELMPRSRANYMGMLRLLDDQLKKFINHLKDNDKYENTIIFFVSDHGDFVGDYGMMRKGPEMPEALMRVPFIAVGPGIKAHTGAVSHMISLVDVMPTICEAIGAEMPFGVQGRSLWPILTDDDFPIEDFATIYGEHGSGGMHFTADDDNDPETCTIKGDGRITSFDCLNSQTMSGVMRMVMRDDWKLLYDMMGNGQMYNLEEDPYELHNLFNNKDYADIQMGLYEDLLGWILRSQDPLMFAPTERYSIKTDDRNYWTPYI